MNLPRLGIGPILTALRNHRAAALLLSLEIAMTLAVLCNLVFIVGGTLQRASTPTGVREDDIGIIQSISVIGEDNPGTAGGNIATLQSVPGVQAAAFGALPLWWVDRQALFADAQGDRALTEAYVLAGSQGLDRTLGVNVIAGRGMDDADIPLAKSLFDDQRTDIPQMPALVTAHLAARLYPGASPLGQVVYSSVFGRQVSLRIVGVVDHLRGDLTGRDSDDDALLASLKLTDEGMGGGYLIRARPGQLEQALPLAAKAMARANPGHVQQRVQTMRQLRQEFFANDRAIAGMLLVILLILVGVTALGIAGLASFWVGQRTRQIGVRRALGATRGDILRYFQLENFLIVSAGIALGALLAYALNLMLMRHFELPRLPASYLACSIPALWLLGQLAVLGPALRAASIPPVVATRSA